MAIFTGIGATDMGVGFTGCRDPVMAGRTTSRNTGMIKSGAAPAVGGMTIITAIAAGNVVGGFAGGYRTIVATCTGAKDGSVINPRYLRKAER